MENPWAGEVALRIDGVDRRMRLTLGALARLETRLDCPSLVALVQRFESGAFSAGDVIAVLEAGLAGAGENVNLGSADIAGGPVAGARAAAQLLARAFMVPGMETGDAA